MRTVRVMIDPEPFWVPADIPLGRVAEEVTEHQVGAAPVCSPDGRIIGLVSKTDLSELYGRADDDRCAQDAMTPQVPSVRADAPIERAARNMAKPDHRVHQDDRHDDARLDPLAEQRSDESRREEHVDERSIELQQEAENGPGTAPRRKLVLPEATRARLYLLRTEAPREVGLERLHDGVAAERVPWTIGERLHVGLGRRALHRTCFRGMPVGKRLAL